MGWINTTIQLYDMSTNSVFDKEEGEDKEEEEEDKIRKGEMMVEE